MESGLISSFDGHFSKIIKDTTPIFIFRKNDEMNQEKMREKVDDLKKRKKKKETGSNPRLDSPQQCQVDRMLF